MSNNNNNKNNDNNNINNNNNKDPMDSSSSQGETVPPSSETIRHCSESPPQYPTIHGTDVQTNGDALTADAMATGGELVGAMGNDESMDTFHGVPEVNDSVGEPLPIFPTKDPFLRAQEIPQQQLQQYHEKGASPVSLAAAAANVFGLAHSTANSKTNQESGVFLSSPSPCQHLNHGERNDKDAAVEQRHEWDDLSWTFSEDFLPSYENIDDMNVADQNPEPNQITSTSPVAAISMDPIEAITLPSAPQGIDFYLEFSKAVLQTWVAFFFAWTSHPCNNIYRRIIKEFSGDRVAYPSWDDDIVPRAMARAAEEGIRHWYTCVGANDKPLKRIFRRRDCAKKGHFLGKWRPAHRPEIAGRIKQRFLDDRKPPKKKFAAAAVVGVVPGPPAPVVIDVANRVPWPHPITTHTVCFEWSDSNGFIRLRQVVRWFATNLIDFPNWSMAVVDGVKAELANEGITDFLILLDSHRQPCLSIREGDFYEASDEEVVQHIRLLFDHSNVPSGLVKRICCGRFGTT